MAETMTAAKWVPGTCTIQTKDGPREVPALTHELVPGLAVTMANFGLFGVTHVATGKRPMQVEFERFASACLIAAKLAYVAKAAGVRWDVEVPDLTAMLACKAPMVGRATITDKDGARQMGCGYWLRTSYQVGWLAGDEFPWESWEESPGGECDKVLEHLVVEAPDAR